MTKIIHCIKVGPSNELGDFELSCIDSWKRVYPDWEIKYWTDKEIKPLMADCKYAVSCYNNKKYAFAGDYARLKILYEYGGLYMDTDVFAVERIPDACFKKPFISWDAGFDTYWSQDGTCLYAPEPKAKILERFIDQYRGFAEYPEFSADNTVIEFTIRKLGLDWYDRTTCQFSNQELEELNIYNCVQFGAFDYTQNLMWPHNDNLPIYLVHARTKSWASYSAEDVYLYYAFIDDNTDNMDIYEAIHAFKDMKLNNLSCKAVLVLGLNTVSDKANWASRWLDLRLKDSKKSYLVAPLGNGLGEDKLNAAFLDFVTKRFNRIKFCRNVLDGSFNGDLTV